MSAKVSELGDTIKDYKDILKDEIHECDEITEGWQNVKENIESGLESVDRTRRAAKNKLRMVQSFEGLRNELGDDTYLDLNRDFVDVLIEEKEKDIEIKRRIEAAKDIIPYRNLPISEVAAISGSIATTATSRAYTLYSLAPDNVKRDIDRLDEICPETIWDHATRIQNFLEEIGSDFHQDLRDTINEWSSLPEGKKWKALRGLRDLIFTRLFENEGFSTLSQFKECSWYDDGSYRYSQIKYFIQKCTRDSDLSNITREVDSVCREMRKYHEQMSKFGKNKTSDSKTEKLIRETLASFLNALVLRKELLNNKQSK